MKALISILEPRLTGYRVAQASLMVADEKDMLEDLIAAAFNDAARKAEETSQSKMGKLTAGMPGLPGGMKFPF